MPASRSGAATRSAKRTSRAPWTASTPSCRPWACAGPSCFARSALFSAATRALVPEMERLGVRRLIAVTGFGAGDSGQAISLVERVPFRLLLGRAYDDKGAQERLISRVHA